MQTALADFRTSLARIRDLADNILANAPAAMGDARLRRLFETQQNGAVVLLTGYFEAFLKDCVRAFAGALSQSGAAFSSLPSEVQNTHFEAGGAVLTRASQAARKGRATHFGPATREDIAARLHSAATAPPGAYQILWEAFADTQANPGPEVVRNIAQSVGLKSAWPSIAQKASLAAAPRVVTDSQLVSKLDDLVSKRNECAHTGTASLVPTAHEINEYIDTLDLIAAGFVGALADHLTACTPAPGGAGAPLIPPPAALPPNP